MATDRTSEPLALLVGLLAGDSGLSRRRLEALLRLRRRQLEMIEGSRGAFVKLVPREHPPLLDLAQLGADSPLVVDYHSLFVLELLDLFPEHTGPLGALADARRGGLDVSMLAAALWSPDGDEQFKRAAQEHKCRPHLLASTLWLALKPLYEAVAEVCLRHFELPGGGAECPVCGGPPWARDGKQLRCGVCETAWQAELPGPWRNAEGAQPRGAQRLYHTKTGARLTELEADLFDHAFDPGPYVELLQAL
jgi:hypothetical protein